MRQHPRGNEAARPLWRLIDEHFAGNRRAAAKAWRVPRSTFYLLLAAETIAALGPRARDHLQRIAERYGCDADDLIADTVPVSAPFEPSAPSPAQLLGLLAALAKRVTPRQKRELVGVMDHAVRGVRPPGDIWGANLSTTDTGPSIFAFNTAAPSRPKVRVITRDGTVTIRDESAEKVRAISDYFDPIGHAIAGRPVNP